MCPHDLYRSTLKMCRVLFVSSNQTDPRVFAPWDTVHVSNLKIPYYNQKQFGIHIFSSSLNCGHSERLLTRGVIKDLLMISFDVLLMCVQYFLVSGNQTGPRVFAPCDAVHVSNLKIPYHNQKQFL